jgi:long-chain acyl-CoA synthetase
VLPSGKNVHPEDIEGHYLRSPLVEELAVLGVQDAVEGRSGAEKLAAVIVPDFEYLRQAKIANSKEAIRHDLDNLGRELPEYQRVRDYIIRAEPLPRTATRKIKRFQLKKELESNGASSEVKESRAWQLSDDDRRALETTVGRAVTAAIRQNSRDAGLIHPRMNLEIDLGLDSLARAETFAALEQAFSTEFEADEAATALTVEAVIELVNRHGGGDVKDVSVSLDWSQIVQKADSTVAEIQPVLQKRPIFGPFVWTAYRLFNLVCRLFFRLEVEGLGNLTSLRSMSTNSAFLVCPNHQSFLDPFVVCSNYPLSIFRDTFHVGASEFWEGRFMRWLARLLHVVPVNPDTELMRAMRAGAAGLKCGKVLHIYPEGERAFDGKLHEFKKGAAILAAELDLPIVPVALDGLYKVWPRRSWRIRLAKVRVRFGTPFYARDVCKNPGPAASPDVYESVISHLKMTIADMIDDMRR